MICFAPSELQGYFEDLFSSAGDEKVVFCKKNPSLVFRFSHPVERNRRRKLLHHAAPLLNKPTSLSKGKDIMCILPVCILTKPA